MTDLDQLTGQEILDTILPPAQLDTIHTVSNQLRNLHNQSSGTERKILYIAFTLVDFVIFCRHGNKSASAEVKKSKFVGRTISTFERYLTISDNDI